MLMYTNIYMSGSTKFIGVIVAADPFCFCTSWVPTAEEDGLLTRTCICSRHHVLRQV